MPNCIIFFCSGSACFLTVVAALTMLKPLSVSTYVTPCVCSCSSSKILRPIRKAMRVISSGVNFA